MNAVLLPSGGAVYVEGMDTRDQAVLLEIRRRVGMVFQNPDNQIVANVVEEDVAFCPGKSGRSAAGNSPAGGRCAGGAGMSGFCRHAPHLLSGGQKQRVAIAGVIAMEPECIVLDEATAMLDPHGRREVLDTIHRLNRERGMTVVPITHHMAEAEEADRVIVMNDGEAAMDGTPRELLHRWSGSMSWAGGAGHGGADAAAEPAGAPAADGHHGGGMCGCAVPAVRAQKRK